MKKILLNKENGFTLIELLVVISIIGVLSTVIFSTMSGARTRAYNAQVRLQVKQLKNALFLARNEATGAFPGVSASWQCLKASGTCWTGGTYSGNATVGSKLSPYISSFPIPPNPPYDSSTEMNGGYLYLPNYPVSYNGSPAGTYLVWAQDGPIPDCKGYYPGAPFEQNYYYCFELVAPLY